jgi:hypothetical protein
LKTSFSEAVSMLSDRALNVGTASVRFVEGLFGPWRPFDVQQVH